MSNKKLNKDLNPSSRKKDHISMAISSVVTSGELDRRFYYEPMLASNTPDEDISIRFLGKKMQAPIWVSSMTGGTSKAGMINKNLAKVCAQFGLGMGLGSCRQLLYSDEYLTDFQLRKYIGNQPLFANLGIAQIEQIVSDNQEDEIRVLIDKLGADGLIIHVNPLQEWLQPEGDRYTQAPIDTIGQLLEKIDIPIIVKEVGQGMGPSSLESLMRLPLAAIEFAAAGGTNFSKLELQRATDSDVTAKKSWTKIGHTALEMIDFYNDIVKNSTHQLMCKEVIISGGIRDFMDGYYALSKIDGPAIYGQASGFLIPAMESYEALEKHVFQQIEGFKLAKTLLKV